MKKPKTSKVITYQYFRNYNQISFLDYSLNLPEYRTQNIYNEKSIVLIRDFYYSWMNSIYYFKNFIFYKKLSQDINFENNLELKKCSKTQLKYQLHLCSQLKTATFEYSTLSNYSSLYNSPNLKNKLITNFKTFGASRILLLFRLLIQCLLNNSK